MSSTLVLTICVVVVLILAIAIGPGYFVCGLMQGCPGSQGRSSLAYALEPLLGYDLGIKTAHLIDLTPFTFTLFAGVVGFFLARKRAEDGDVKASLSAMNSCDGCGTTVARSEYLTKVEGKGFLCPQCRSLARKPTV